MYDPSEALLQLGLYDYVWGNPALLQTYNANVQAAKARKEQQDYNMMWKNIELAKLNREKEKADALKLNELNKEFDELQYKLTQTQDPLEIAWIQKQMRKVRADAAAQGAALRGEDRDFDRAYAEQKDYDAYLNEFARKLKRSYGTEAEKNATLEAIDKDEKLTDKSKTDLKKEIAGIESQEAKNAAAISQAIANHAGKNTSEGLDEADLQQKANEAIKNNTFESASTPLGKQIRKTHYWVKGTGWKKN